MLVLLNKRDLNQAQSIEKLVADLEFVPICQETGRQYFVQPTIATTGEGLHEGVRWLCDHMSEL